MNMMSPDINLSKEAPQEEPLRQYYYIEKAKQYVEEEAKNLGRSLTFLCHYFWVPDECQRFRKVMAEF